MVIDYVCQTKAWFWQKQGRIQGCSWALGPSKIKKTHLHKFVNIWPRSENFKMEPPKDDGLDTALKIQEPLTVEKYHIGLHESSTVL